MYLYILLTVGRHSKQRNDANVPLSLQLTRCTWIHLHTSMYRVSKFYAWPQHFFSPEYFYTFNRMNFKQWTFFRKRTILKAYLIFYILTIWNCAYCDIVVVLSVLLLFFEFHLYLSRSVKNMQRWNFCHVLRSIENGHPF